MIIGSMQSFPLTLDRFLAHAAKWHPHAEVATLREDGGIDRIGYDRLRERSLRISAALRTSGVRPGDHVATLAWNNQAHLELFYAIVGMGAVCHTLNPRLPDIQLAEMAEQSEARILFASADLMPLARRIADRNRRIERLVCETDEYGEEGEIVWGDFDENAPCGLCFTSGTTGAPKGVTYTHRSSFLHTLRILQADSMAISGADAVLAVVPMFHANAWGLTLAAPAVGAKLVLPGRRSGGADLAHLINAEEVTIAAGVATVWLGLLDHLEATGGEVPSLKRIIVGGGAMPPALMDRIERRLGAVVQTSWGMTELSPSGTVSPAYLPERSASRSGRPAIGVDLILTDAEGRALADQRGVEGHLRVRGAAVIQHYFGETEPATDAGGWFPTGDLARIGPEGDLVITGRAKDLIKSGGEWINPAEIEAAVAALPEVSLAAVIGRADPKWGERPILLVETRKASAISDEALLAPLRGTVASWWIPDEVIRLPSMPLTSTGKVDKKRLRSEYGAG